MKLTTTQPVEGVSAGHEVDVDNDRAAWLVANGYATKPGGNPATFDGRLATTVPADQDPTNGSRRPAEHTDVRPARRGAQRSR